MTKVKILLTSLISILSLGVVGVSLVPVINNINNNNGGETNFESLTAYECLQKITEDVKEQKYLSWETKDYWDADYADYGESTGAVEIGSNEVKYQNYRELMAYQVYTINGEEYSCTQYNTEKKQYNTEDAQESAEHYADSSFYFDYLYHYNYYKQYVETQKQSPDLSDEKKNRFTFTEVTKTTLDDSIVLSYEYTQSEGRNGSMKFSFWITIKNGKVVQIESISYDYEDDNSEESFSQRYVATINYETTSKVDFDTTGYTQK